jgi:hypothetical protein
VAYGKKTGGKNFQKGEKWNGNPNGRPPLPAAVKELRKLTTKEFIERINKYLYLSKDKLRDGIGSGKIEVLDLVIRNSLIKCIEKGDYYMFDKMMERLIGKPKEEGGQEVSEQLKQLVEAMQSAAKSVVENKQ